VVAVLLGRWVDRSAGFVLGAALTLAAVGGLAVLGVVEVGRALVAAVVLVAAVSLVVVMRLDGVDREWGTALRSRLLMGVPWGTLVVVGLVLSVYLFVQDGLASWNDPVTIPFRAWSYLYPLGVVAAGFSHNGPGHLIGNLAGTVVLGSLAEYAWGHYATGRGVSTFASWRHNPYVRAFVVFPAVVVGVGLLTAAFAMGPVIGFSGVVFAFAGFALTRYPLGTVVASVGFGAAQTVYYAVRDPTLVATAQPAPPSPPWWAQIAIQGHGLGLLIGIVLGWYVFVRRSDGPSALRVWAGVFLFGMLENLWAVYWFLGNERYRLFRGHGIVLVTLLALLVTAALTASQRRLTLASVRRRAREAGLPASVRTDGGDGGTGSDPGGRTPAVDPGSGSGSGDDRGDPADLLTGRNVAVALLLVGLVGIAAPGFGSNVFAASAFDAPDDGVEVGDYTVFYAEDVTNEMVAIVDVSFFNQTTQVRTSGVIVTSEERRIWQQAVSKGRLAFLGSAGVDVGGVGWRETVGVVRRGWKATGGSAVYKVWLVPPDGEPRLAFRSDASAARAVIDGRNVTVAPGEDEFRLHVVRGNTTIGEAPIPTSGNATEAGGLRFLNRDGTLFAARNETLVQVAEEETYDHG
jgi:membrane associated rhomboid family serine protease